MGSSLQEVKKELAQEIAVTLAWISEVDARRIAHYKWMLETLTLNPKHRAWIENKISKLEESK